MDIATLFKIGRNVVARKWRQSFVPRTTLDQELVAAGADFPSWLKERRQSRRTYTEIDEQHLGFVKKALPHQLQHAVASAEQALLHRFDLLGSGSYEAVDPERSARSSGYQPIDWYLDPVRKVRFPRGIPIKEWKLYEMRPKDADIKFPWELARCQHFAALGQAWRFTSDRRFAHEIIDQIDDFIEANPVGIGVNWTCTMDVGLRAANWAIGLALIKGCSDIDETRWQSAYGALFEHGRFIFTNLENTYEVTSNHFLSNVVGLHFIAAEFPETASGKSWDAFCRKSLETEIDVQILPDGADFESSVPYHRLVAELFLGSWRLAELQERPLSDHYRERLCDMVSYLAGVLRPDGLMPQLGDADDGRLHIFTDWATWQRQDGRHLLGAAGAIFDRADWRALAGPDGAWEAVWWGKQIDSVPIAATPSEHVHLYGDAGAFVARREGTYLLVTNAKVGTKGFGNHKHNDQLGFEWHVEGQAVIADPGSYVYTSDFAARNLFRSTAHHSTLMIDEVEQNEFNPEWLFRMFEKADATHIEHGRNGDIAFYAGRHTGYNRLEEVVTHARRFECDLRSGRLSISDRLDGVGRHNLVWRFMLAPDVKASVEEPGGLLIRGERFGAIRLTYAPDLEAELVSSWYSPSYGVRIATQAVKLSCSVDVAGRPDWSFMLSPCTIGNAG